MGLKRIPFLFSVPYTSSFTQLSAWQIDSISSKAGWKVIKDIVKRLYALKSGQI